ncbi:ABC transporter, partial [Modestobacter roseus]|nr:ABC transporter [Modestobacter roseus]
LLSWGVNGAGAVVMVAVFASTAGLSGAEVAIAGGTTALGQRVLEAVFGDAAVRELAARARADLDARADALLRDEQARFAELLAGAAPAPGAAGRLHTAVAALAAAR